MPSANTHDIFPLIHRFIVLLTAGILSTKLIAAENIAPLADATTSYVSAWETLSAVNDGSTPQNSNDKSSGAYGNWPNPNSTQWVAYEWPEKYALSDSEIYWFDDNGGVLTPTTAYIEYWDGTQWLMAGTIATEKNRFNKINLSNIHTSRLRVSMLNPRESTGILEWRVFGEPESLAENTLVIEEREPGFCDMYGSIDNNHPGYSASGFSNTANSYGSFIEYAIDVPVSDYYTLEFIHANGSSERSAQLLVDNQSQTWFAFPGTGAWSQWQKTAPIGVWLEQGNHILRVEATNNSGLPNIDNLQFTGKGPAPGRCNSNQTSSSSIGVVSSSSSSSSSILTQACEAGSTTTAWATHCPNTNQCRSGRWYAPEGGGETGAPLRLESDHFAFYWKDGTNITTSQAQDAANTLEMIWRNYFGTEIGFQEPYCDSSTKWKAAVHFDNSFPLWGGSWARNGRSYAGMWVGPGAARDSWGLAHEFMHGVQALTPAFSECGGQGCWIFESHANWMPHQIFRDNVHCSEMLVNSPHLHYGNTRNRYCNWQVFEYLKDRHCPSAVNSMWTANAPAGQRDPWQKLMYNQNWDIEQLNDLFGEWAMHNVTWDYRDPNGNDQGAVYKRAYGPITDTDSRYTQRRLRMTQAEALNNSWQTNRRFASPYYQAPQRWGYNVIQLHPETNASSVTIKFQGVEQPGADSGWRWGLVATDRDLNNPRYSSMQTGSEAELNFCLNNDEQLYLVVLAAPTAYQKITWTQPMDGTAYPSIYRYPYMFEVHGAWPDGFTHGTRDACPANTVRHNNGGGCATTNTPDSVYVGPYAIVKGGNVSGNARIEDHAAVINGTVSGGTVGALSTVGVESNPHHGSANFNVRDNATLLATFYPMGWFANNASLSGNATYVGDLEVYAGNKSNNTFYGLVDNNTQGVPYADDITVSPPYYWR